MHSMFFAVSSVIIAGVLLASGVAKLRHPADESEWEQLGLPRWLQRSPLIRLHPYAEIALAVAVLILGSFLGLAAGIIAVVLFAFYLGLIIQAHRTVPDASCACFGESRPITQKTIVRNVWMLVLAVATAATTWATPLIGGPLREASQEWLILPALAAAVITVWLSVESGPATSRALQPDPQFADADPLDYHRVRTPAVPVTLGDGTTASLRTLAAQQPLLLLAVSETCASCVPVSESVSSWREQLPELSIRYLVGRAPENSELTESSGDQSLHDPEHLISASIEDWRTPTAVLFGADGMLAGGPVTGAPQIEESIRDIEAELHPFGE